MDQLLLFSLLGLGTGAVYALLSLGLVVEYRGSGVLNFAQGALAMWIAFVFAGLRSSGDLTLPLFGSIGSLNLGSGGIALVPAIAIALAYAALLGAGLYWLLFNPLRTAPGLSKVVVSVGLLVTLQGLALLRFGATPPVVGPVLPGGPVTVLGVQVGAERLWLAAIAVALAALLWAGYRFTRFGHVTRAVAENQEGAILSGYSPGWIACANWALGAVLAGAAGILMAPLTPLDPGVYTLLIVPALAAALLARFESFPVALLGGLGLGIAQSLLTKLQADGLLPQSGVQEALPFLVIAVAMFAMGKALPTRGDIVENRLPRVAPDRPVWRSALIWVAVGAVAIVVLDGSDRLALIQSLIFAVACLSLVVLTGYVGQISLAQMAFAGVGGFVLSHLTEGAGIPFPASLLLAAFAAVPLGLLLGLPALRIRGVQLATVTLAAAVALEQLVFENPDLVGAQGSKVPAMSVLGLNLDITGATQAGYPRIAFGLSVLALVGIVGVAVAWLRRSALGRSMLAVRSDERAAAAIGANVPVVKLTAFATSAFIGGLAGALLGYSQHVLSAQSFAVAVSLQVLAITYIGGIGRVSGAVLAAVCLAPSGLGATLLEQAGLGKYLYLISGIGLMAVAVIYRDGVVVGVEQLEALLRRRLRPAPRAPNPMGSAAR